MQPPKTSAHFLAQNVARLSEKTPGARAIAQKKGVKRSTWYTILAEDKSPTLETVDKLSETFDAPAWLLLHPQMKVWDQNRTWIDHLIQTYLDADDKGREHIHSAIRLVDERIGKPLPDEFGRTPEDLPAQPRKRYVRISRAELDQAQEEAAELAKAGAKGARTGRKLHGVTEGAPERRQFVPRSK